MRTIVGLLAAAVAAVVFVAPAAAGWPGNNGHTIFGDPSDGTDYIWSVNPDGTGLTKIFSHGTEHATPGDISPDGTSLVVVDRSFSLSVISLPPSAPNEVVLDAHDNSSL